MSWIVSGLFKKKIGAARDVDKPTLPKAKVNASQMLGAAPQRKTKESEEKKLAAA